MFAQRTVIPRAEVAGSLNSNRAPPAPRQHIGNNLPDIDAPEPAARDAPPGAAWDFGRVPLFSPARAVGDFPPAPYAPLPQAGGIQAKLATEQADDPLEQEADRIAERVTGAEATGHAEPHGAAVPVPAPAPAAAQAQPGPAGELDSGAPLERPLRARMEGRFGHDFSDVRVHTGTAADRAARSFGALAYTRGRDVVFSGGQYAPHTPSGQRLLAHELAHVAQQRTAAAPAAPQLKAAATRFQDEPTLDEVSDGKKVLKEGDKGEAVIRVTTALSELGHYKINIIDENFDPPLTSAVSSYQASKGLSGKVPAGRVEKNTFAKLDKDFSAGFQVERDVLAAQKAPNLLAQTQNVDPAERAASARAISTEPPVSPVTGLPPVFRPSIPGKGSYGDRLRAVVDKEIVDEWTTTAQGKTAAHATPGALYDAPTVDAVAVESETAVKAVFGEYVKGRPSPPLKMGVNVEDAWKKKESTLAAGGKAAEDAAVDWRVQKILDGDKEVKKLDREHGAIQSRAPEQAIVAPIKADMMVKYRAKLLELHKAWPGFASGGVIHVQLFKGASADAQRYERWDYFQTFIHEYIHTLEHPQHVLYRGGLGQQKGGFTLREGTTDYFTKIVWNSLTIDDALRARIEGPVHDPVNKFKIQPLNTYDEAKNAERLAGVVGIRNVAAAFFLGKVELIGKP
jgi:peptidoglycan hydrolase-like protein with peptidoglycan-binding domain